MALTLFYALSDIERRQPRVRTIEILMVELVFLRIPFVKYGFRDAR